MSKLSTFLGVTVALPLYAVSAHAQDTDPSVVPIESPAAPPPARLEVTSPTAEPSVETPPSPPPVATHQPAPAVHATSDDSDAVFRAFDLYADHERSTRIAESIVGIVLGGTTMGVGAAVAEKTDTSHAPWLIVGGITTGLAALGLIVRSPAERIASEMRTGASGHTAAEALALEARWQRLAEEEAFERIVGGVVTLAIGTGAVASGIPILAGATDLNDDQEAIVGGLLIGAGAGLLVGGTAIFFLRKPAERSYTEYRAAKPVAPTLDVSVGASPTGAFIGAYGTF